MENAPAQRAKTFVWRGTGWVRRIRKEGIRRGNAKIRVTKVDGCLGNTHRRCTSETAANLIVVFEDPIGRVFSAIGGTHAAARIDRMVIQDVIEVVVTSDINGNAVLVVIVSYRVAVNVITGLRRKSGHTLINVNWMSRVQLEETSNRPATKYVSDNALLAL